MDRKHTISAIVSDTAADLTASNVVENLLSCRPQSILTIDPKPFIIVASSINAIFPTLDLGMPVVWFNIEVS